MKICIGCDKIHSRTAMLLNGTTQLCKFCLQEAAYQLDMRLIYVYQRERIEKAGEEVDDTLVEVVELHEKLTQLRSRFDERIGRLWYAVKDIKDGIDL